MYSLPFSVANTQKIHTSCVSTHNSIRKRKIAFRGYFLPRAVIKFKDIISLFNNHKIQKYFTRFKHTSVST